MIAALLAFVISGAVRIGLGLFAEKYAQLAGYVKYADYACWFFAALVVVISLIRIIKEIVRK